MADRAERLRLWLEDHEDSIDSGCCFDPEDPERFLLVEKSRYDGALWITQWTKPVDAADYHDGQEYTNDWIIEYLLDLDTGNEHDPATQTSFDRTEAEIAWAAGLFEGEGWITTGRDARGRPRRILGLTMTDEDVVRRFAATMGVGKIKHRSPRGSEHKPTFTWQVGGVDDVRHVLELFLPWLGNRRSEKAKEALESCRTSRVTQTRESRAAVLAAASTGLSQTQIAARLGVSQSAVSNYLRGDKT